MVEQSAVNRSVVGSSPTVGVFAFFGPPFSPPFDHPLAPPFFHGFLRESLVLKGLSGYPEDPTNGSDICL